MTTQSDSVEMKAGKCLIENWVEERAASDLDSEGSRVHIQKSGHRGILTMDMSSKLEDITTLKTHYPPPKGPGVRHRGIRSELLEKYITQSISEQTRSEFNPAPPKTDFRSTTKKDFTVEGFVPVAPKRTREHDYINDQAVTFWRENHQYIQGVTPVRSGDNNPFTKSAFFSTPVPQRLDEPVFSLEN